jgi:hypothetical protein
MSTALRYNQNRQRHPEHGLLVARALNPNRTSPCASCHFYDPLAGGQKCTIIGTVTEEQFPCAPWERTDKQDVLWIQTEPPRTRLPEALEHGE